MPECMSNPALQGLEALVGEWEMESPLGPGVHGRATFDWLEGGAFLVQHLKVDHAGVPNATMIIGGDDSVETYCVLYFDSRGVSRVYQMSLTDGVWKMWREAPSFWQRFEGTFSDDHRTIRGHWDASDDGANWRHDFELTYTRVR